MMTLSNIEEHIFFLCIFAGVISGVMFDVFTVLKNATGNKAAITNLCDASFWSLYTASFLWWIFRVYDGQLRWFVFVGIIMGAAIYFLLFSKIVVYLGTAIFKLIIKAISFAVKIIVFPIVFILKKSFGAIIVVISPLKKFNKKARLCIRGIRKKIKSAAFFTKKTQKI